MTGSAVTQTKTEIGILTDFAKLGKIPIVVESIEKREPPEPDIRCALAGDGPLAFEMVEVLDEARVARPLGIQIKVEDTFRSELESLEEDHRQKLKRRLGNATINVRINQIISIVKRTALIRKILDVLRDVDPSFESEVQLPEKLAAFAWLEISRGNFDGPRFKSFTASHYDPIPTVAITKKLNRTDYKTDAAIELLAYFDTQHATLCEQIERLVARIRKQVQLSVFRRVWI